MKDTVFYEKVYPTLIGLWPLNANKLTPELMASWSRCAGNYSVEQCIAALRAMMDDGVEWPAPSMLRKKLVGRHGEHGYTQAESLTARREREQWEQENHETRTIIDAMSDEELAGHALMRAASNPDLLWTLALDPRKDRGMNAVIAIRVRAGLGPDDEAAPVRMPNGKYELENITTESIERAKRIKSGAEPMPVGGLVIYQAKRAAALTPKTYTQGDMNYERENPKHKNTQKGFAQ